MSTGDMPERMNQCQRPEHTVPAASKEVLSGRWKYIICSFLRVSLPSQYFSLPMTTISEECQAMPGSLRLHSTSSKSPCSSSRQVCTGCGRASGLCYSHIAHFKKLYHLLHLFQIKTSCFAQQSIQDFIQFESYQDVLGV